MTHAQQERRGSSVRSWSATPSSDSKWTSSSGWSPHHRPEVHLDVRERLQPRLGGHRWKGGYGACLGDRRHL